ncbi:hypothetical protein NZD16_000251 [Escherichia coli]|nr:hypothetical protein [Escherichia coli]
MKSSLRFLGQELVVEGVIPADNAFNEAVYDEFIKIFGTDKKFGILIFPSENFSKPEQTESIFQGVVTGKFESEAPVKIEVYIEDSLVASVAAFISFRK